MLFPHPWLHCLGHLFWPGWTGLCLAGGWSTLETTAHPRIATGTCTVHVDDSCPSVRHQILTILSGPDTKVWHNLFSVEDLIYLAVNAGDALWRTSTAPRCRAPVASDRLFLSIAALFHHNCCPTAFALHFASFGCQAQKRCQDMEAHIAQCFSFCFPCLSLSVPSLRPLNRLILSEQGCFRQQMACASIGAPPKKVLGICRGVHGGHKKHNVSHRMVGIDAE